MRLEEVPWPELGRPLFARAGTSDRDSIEAAREGRYHVPPESMPTPQTVLDLGCNVGATLAHYRHLWLAATITGVEMDYGNAEGARMNAPGVRVRCEAVSARGGIQTYDETVDTESFRLGEGTKHVPTYTLRQIILRSFEHPPTGDPTPVDFVKADIEGAEWALFEYGEEWAPLVRSMLVELHRHGAPRPPSGPRPKGRDGPSHLLAAAIPRLEALGFRAVPHVIHPAAVFAWREDA